MSTPRTPASISIAVQGSGEHVPGKSAASPSLTALRTLALWRMRSSQRNALRELAKEDRLLADTGLTRERALAEAAKPFWRR